MLFVFIRNRRAYCSTIASTTSRCNSSYDYCGWMDHVRLETRIAGKNCVASGYNISMSHSIHRVEVTVPLDDPVALGRVSLACLVRVTQYLQDSGSHPLRLSRCCVGFANTSALIPANSRFSGAARRGRWHGGSVHTLPCWSHRPFISCQCSFAHATEPRSSFFASKHHEQNKCPERKNSRMQVNGSALGGYGTIEWVPHVLTTDSLRKLLLNPLNVHTVTGILKVALRELPMSRSHRLGSSSPFTDL